MLIKKLNPLALLPSTLLPSIRSVLAPMNHKSCPYPRGRGRAGGAAFAPGPSLGPGMRPAHPLKWA